ncbi:hypothetical protein C5167_017227 [Papaver somniferum]|uniref:Uncharacterized protein n=1 Tax=Papaver somniferum TaxID=3469 RepID=A0A4Y7IMU7_PAPSO|nr:hypothetical protein C5167_017227 [Papaver somniferum]
MKEENSDEAAGSLHQAGAIAVMKSMPYH